MSITELARQIGFGGFGVRGQVINETGLTGLWDFGFDYSRIRSYQSTFIANWITRFPPNPVTFPRLPPSVVLTVLNCG
jgi:hypothetical protein